MSTNTRSRGNTVGKKPAQDPQKDVEANPPPQTTEEAYPNYRPGLLLLLSHLVVFLILTIMTFFAPTSSTGIISVSNGEEYVGVLRSCSGGTCSALMATSESSHTD
jgi:hypothetical protein